MPRKFSEDQTRKQMKVPSFFGGANLQLGVPFVDYCRLSNDQNYSIFARFAICVFAEVSILTPLDMFGVDAVERWFTEKEVEEVVEFANRLSA